MGQTGRVIRVDVAHGVWEELICMHLVMNLVSGAYGLIWQAVGFVLLVFHIWMLVDAIRRQEWIWAVFIFLFPPLNDLLYYFFVYRPSGGGNPLAGFELPGAADRKRIKELQAEIYHLDRPYHHLQLADIYMAQGKLDKAEASYRAAYERDSKDEDIRAHLGTCLTRVGKVQEALPLLESVCSDNPKHDYGYTLMTLAEAQTAMGQADRAIATWQQVLVSNSYSRAKVQYAELLIGKQDYAQARKLLQGVVNDAPYVPKFQMKTEKVWIGRAKAALGKIPG